MLERCIPSFRLELEWTPVRKKEEWNPSLQLQRIQDSHVRFALDFFFEIAHFSFTCHFELARDPTFAYEVHCIYIYNQTLIW